MVNHRSQRATSLPPKPRWTSPRSSTRGAGSSRSHLTAARDGLAPDHHRGGHRSHRGRHEHPAHDHVCAPGGQEPGVHGQADRCKFLLPQPIDLPLPLPIRPASAPPQAPLPISARVGPRRPPSPRCPTAWWHAGGAGARSSCGAAVGVYCAPFILGPFIPWPPADSASAAAPPCSWSVCVCPRTAFCSCHWTSPIARLRLKRDCSRMCRYRWMRCGKQC